MFQYILPANIFVYVKTKQMCFNMLICGINKC